MERVSHACFTLLWTKFKFIRMPKFALRGFTNGENRQTIAKNFS